MDFDQYTAQLLAETREELTRADSKASLLFAAFGVVLGALLAGVISHKWQPADLAPVATVVFWFGAALAVGGVLGLGYAVWPRIVDEKADWPASYYGHIVAYGSDREALRAALDKGVKS